MGAILGFVWQGIQWLAKKTAELAIIIAKATAAAAKIIWGALKHFGKWSLDAAKWVVNKGIPWILDQIDKALRAIDRALVKVGEWLQRKFPGLFKVFKFLVGLWDRLSRLVMKLLSIIGLVRILARILGKLGIKWGTKLNAWLYGLELKIYQGFEAARGWMSWARSWINLLADPRGLLRFSTLMHSVKQFHTEMWGVLVSVGVQRDRRQANADRAKALALLSLEQSLEQGLTMGGVSEQAVAEAEKRFIELTTGKRG